MPDIREAVLRDPRYPVSAIADALLPYLRVLVEQFAPQQVILFGSHAYGTPTPDSDVDLLIVKDLADAPVRESTRIRRAWWPLRLLGTSLPFDLLVESAAGHAARLAEGGAYYREITSRGLRLV
ncbi:MAG: nucleotidyltransferase domain-containing protein [Armatimonadetes bacterium]|nr:nucleotidyltransferase domain-containing protein [Armatimonadota bacterium]